MDAMKRKAESGRIWKNSAESREKDGKRQRQKEKQKIYLPNSLG
jgi:hypothetical protein